MFRRLPEKPEYEPQIIDPHYQRNPYWNDDLYDQKKLEYKHKFNTPPELFEDDEKIIDSNVSDKLGHSSIDLWTVNPQMPNTLPLPKFRPATNLRKCHKLVIDTEMIRKFQSIFGNNTNLLPLPANIQLKNKSLIFYFPMDFGELTIDGLIDSGALTSVVSGAV